MGPLRIEGNREWLKEAGPGANQGGSNPRRVVRGMSIQIAYVLIDICCVFLNGAIAFSLRFSGINFHHILAVETLSSVYQPLNRYGAFLLLYAALIVLFCQSRDLYRTPRTRTADGEFVAIVQAVFLATLILTTFIYLSGVSIVSRLVVLISLFLNVFILTMWRYAKRQLVIRRAERGIGARNVVIIGAGRVGQALKRRIEADKLLGYRFKGFLDENHSGDPSLLGKIEDLSRIARVEFLDEVLITIPSARDLVKRIVLEAPQHRLDVKIVPDLYDGLAWNATLGHIGDFPVLDLHWKPIPSLGLLVKRVIDVVASLCALILTAPLLIIAAIWIKSDSPGPVIYSSPRVGKKGRVFRCYKLRTMVANADELKEALRHRNEREGPFFKISADPRITAPGAFCASIAWMNCLNCGMS